MEQLEKLLPRHLVKCGCCSVYQRKVFLTKIKRLPKEMKQIAKQYLPSSPGSYYKIPDDHVDVCECCQRLRKYRSMDNSRDRKKYEKHKLSEQE